MISVIDVTLDHECVSAFTCYRETAEMVRCSPHGDGQTL
ncbi:hypothetical protein RHOER0001_3754 [Rhodococcus erythropolis SK121]|nr:hypothetical protein RHOER0001_3754 [Rhodococcus erythropolis SK121]